MNTPLSAGTVIPTKSGETISDVQTRIDKDRIKRFEACTYNNKSTGFIILNALCQGFDTQNDPPPEGYVADTGVTVIGVNIGPGSSSTANIQPQINVLANRVECNMRWRRISDGQEGVHTHKPMIAPDGQYWPRASFGIKDAGTKDGAPEFYEEMEVGLLH
jgi:hypothetical protein